MCAWEHVVYNSVGMSWHEDSGPKNWTPILAGRFAVHSKMAQHKPIHSACSHNRSFISSPLFFAMHDDNPLIYVDILLLLSLPMYLDILFAEICYAHKAL